VVVVAVVAWVIMRACEGLEPMKAVAAGSDTTAGIKASRPVVLGNPMRLLTQREKACFTKKRL